MANLLENINFRNSFLTIEDGELKYMMRSTYNLKDFRYLEKYIERTQLTNEPVVVDWCYRMCKSSECAADSS